jgi:asparagine synthase (glutamine-hydrolysing)
MCGIAGFMDLGGRRNADLPILQSMLDSLKHRGPDGQGSIVRGSLAMGTRRLSIVDIHGSHQPLHSANNDIVLIGNGEIFNYVELRKDLVQRGHKFRTDGDLEVVLHLYEEMGSDFVKYVNGQFSIVVYENSRNQLTLFRDHFGVTPLFYAVFEGTFIFASEVKGILCHPLARREVDLAGLDQIVCFPGLVSPRTMFAGVRALRPGHWLRVNQKIIEEQEYWDLDYPTLNSSGPVTADREPTADFLELFDNSVRLRMRADRPVGVYLSGGLDSSLVAASMRRHRPSKRIVAFSVVFPEFRAIDERRFQQMMVKRLGLEHIEVPFTQSDIATHLEEMVWHAECPVKETYNICSLALARTAKSMEIPVVLGGEGADELFAGYPGYRFDSLGSSYQSQELGTHEADARSRLWGNKSVRYERMYHQFGEWRRQFYSDAVLAEFEPVDGLARPPVNTTRLAGRHPIHQRSYLDCKLRLADHLLGDHGDRMAMANSVEGRYPFLDRQVVDFVRVLSPNLKVQGLDEKILLKAAAAGRVPDAIVRREKFGFRAPGSPALLKLRLPFIDDWLNPSTLRRQGYLNVNTIEKLSTKYQLNTSHLNPHTDDDLLLIALTFSIFLGLFGMPDL